MSATLNRLDRLAPQLLLVALGLVSLIVISPSTWVTLTVAGIAMGMIIFLMAAGLSLIFGLMSVLNFGHGAFVTFGAFVAASVLAGLSAWTEVPSVWLNVAAISIALIAAVAVTGVLGWVFERVIVLPVYGDHLRQILVTVGALIVAEQIVPVIWGPVPITVPRPFTFQGSFVFGDIAIEKFRVLAIVLGVTVFVVLHQILIRTRIGLLIRAGVENREMIQAMGYRIDVLFVGVFVAGSALAGLGGVMWALFNEIITASIGAEALVLAFIVIIIGGLGSVGGSFLGALLVGLTANYVGFLSPTLALGSNILLMVLILLWRPYGLFPLAKL